MSPILTIQQRHAEHGRIRIGQKVATRNGKNRPDKLDRFRFTSGNRDHIDALATLYGGQPREWANGSKTEWEVVTEARTIPVIAVKGGMTQWLETWSGGGCIHRCDGYHDVLTDTDCDPQDPKHQQAKPTTRLSVMLRDLESLGVWRLETHGWNAACELPSMAELATFVGDYVPASLVLQQRTSVRDGKTSQYVVPVLDLAITKHRLNEAIEQARPGSSAAALTPAPGQDTPQIEAARPDYATLLQGAGTVEECQAIWRQAGEAGHLDQDLKDAITARAREVKDDQPTPPPAGEVIDAAILDDPVAADHAWQRVVTAAGAKGITTSRLAEIADSDFDAPIADLSADQLDDLLTRIESGEVTA